MAATNGHRPGREVTRELIERIARGEPGAKLRSQVTAWHPGATGDQQRPAYAVFGEETEAIDYAAGAGELWGNVPGALAWLES